MAHVHEKIDFTVEVFIVYNNRVLLRKHDKYKLWLSVGGHIELDEDPVQAIFRETREEVGLHIELFHPGSLSRHDGYKELIPPQFMNRHRINEKHEHVTMTYFARSTTMNLELSSKEVSEDCRWFSLTELDEPSYSISEDVKMYAKAALKTLGGLRLPLRF